LRIFWNIFARWYIFIPDIPIWVYFGGPWNGKCWYVLWPFWNYYGHWVDFVGVWFIFSTFWYIVSRQIWQPCSESHLFKRMKVRGRFFKRVFEPTEKIAHSKRWRLCSSVRGPGVCRREVA
jgi:hypothetical protein